MSNSNIENSKEEIKEAQNIKKVKSKKRTLVVLLFIILFVILTYIALRGSYLEYKEL